ncbi:MAG: FUSC family protein [Geminicoccaceae bacterium]
MLQLGWRDAAFSLKTFAAAMLALYIAFAIPLPQPIWAMLTVYVVSQPLAGMVQSKSLYRVVGTVIGSAMSLVLVDQLADTPRLFLLALAAWIGASTSLAVYLRDVPAAYGAMLSGYTAAIIGVPAALAPPTAFDSAWARCLEITLGIACATLMSQLVMPRRAGDVLLATLDAALAAGRQWTVDVLRGQGDAANGLADRRKLVADIVMLDSLRAHAVYDTPTIRAAADGVRHLQARLMTLLSLLVGVHDRLVILRGHRPELLAGLQPLLDRSAERLPPRGDRAPAGDEAGAVSVTGRPDFAALRRDGDRLLPHTVLLRLDEVQALLRDLGHRRDRLLEDAGAQEGEAPAFARYRDPMLAAVGGLVSTMAVLSAAAFWIATAWPNGSQAVIFAGIICTILASLDDPAAAATSFLKMTVYATVVAAFYVFLVFPRIDGFLALVAVLMPFYLPLGMFLALPRIGPTLLPLALNTTALLGLTNERATVPDLAAFLNSALGLLAGVTAGVVMFRLLRPLGVSWTVRRLTADMMADLAQLARSGAAVPRFRFESRMYDRINALFSRLDSSDPAQLATMRDSLAALRVGLNTLALARALPRLTPEPRTAGVAVLAALAHWFDAPGAGAGGPSPVAAIDAAMDRLLASGEVPGVAEALVALGGIRTSLSQHRAFFALPAAEAA